MTEYHDTYGEKTHSIRLQPERTRFETGFLRNEFHLVCPANSGKTTFGCFGIKKRNPSGYSGEEAKAIAEIVNCNNQPLCLFPKINMTLLPVWLYENQFGDTIAGTESDEIIDRMVEAFHRCLVINEELVKNTRIYFELHTTSNKTALFLACQKFSAHITENIMYDYPDGSH